MCRKLLQRDTPISSHKASPLVASLATSFVQPHDHNGHGPRNMTRTSARLRSAENEHTVSSILTHGGATTREATRCPEKQPNPNHTRLRAEHRNPSYGRPKQLPQTLRTSRVTTPNPSDGSGRGWRRSTVTPDVGEALLPDTSTQGSTTPTQHLLRTREQSSFFF